ncbi:hypothetical protein BC669P2_00014 [Bacteroides phage BC669P2]|nr:hypothetical protein BC669P2_00014 [Bacteroides phage BC669P2]
MKKLISILVVVVLFAVSAMAQVTSNTGRLETIKSFRLGVCKLIKAEKEGAVTYQITATVANASSHELDIPLGDEKAAVALLTSLAEYKPTKGEVVNLNNVDGNTATYWKFNGTWQIYGRGRTLYIAVSRKELSTMAKVIGGK